MHSQGTVTTIYLQVGEVNGLGRISNDSNSILERSRIKESPAKTTVIPGPLHIPKAQLQMFHNSLSRLSK